MRYPEFLKPGGTIGFIAPSFGCNIEPYCSTFENAKKKFAKMGYRLSEGPNCREGCGIGISNTPQKCGQEMNEYYTSRENDVLISCGGGELMCEVLNYVDFAAVREADPKWFMGYSDNTNFTFLLTTLCDTASIYGPCVSSFGMEKWHPAIEDAFCLLSGKNRKRTSGGADAFCLTGYDGWERESLKSEENPCAPYHVTEPKKLVVYPPQAAPGGVEELTGSLPDHPFGTPQAVPGGVEFSGRLLGGCMDCLVTLLGTKFDRTAEFVERYQKDGIVWFLEACDLNVMSIRRALWQMDNAGWFRYTKGFLVGRPLHYGEELFGLDQYRAVTGILGKYGVPVVMDADIGHLPPMMPLICGSYAKIQVNGDDYRVWMELV